MTKIKDKSIVLGSIAFIICFIYIYPRFLIQQLGEANPWTSYFYLYGFGFVFFAGGMTLILKTKALQFNRGRDSFWFAVLLAGFSFFATLHALWVYFAINVPINTGLQ